MWQGTQWSEMPERFPEAWRIFQERPALSTAGESLAAQGERMERLIRRAGRRYPHGSLVLVSHRDPIVALRLRVEGRPLDDLHGTPCDFASITAFAFAEGHLTFRCYREL
jgi:broad specificity phosphatase PhoE